MQPNRQYSGTVATIEQLLTLRHKAAELTFFPRVMANSPLTGLHRSRLRGRGMDFDEVRPYQAGDDIRTIDWRVTARTTTPHTKIFREERERPVLLIADLRGNMLFGSRRLKAVVACEVTAALAWAGLAANERIGGMIFTAEGQQDIRSKRSHHVVLRLIHALHEAGNALLKRSHSDLSLTEITQDMRRVVHPGTSVFLISDFHDMDANCEANLSKLARHSDLTLIQVYDELEARLPPPGTAYQVFDGQNRFTLDTGSRDARQRYEQRFNQRQQQLGKIADRLQAPLIRVKTSSAVMPLLHKAYGRGRNGKRR